MVRKDDNRLDDLEDEVHGKRHETEIDKQENNHIKTTKTYL